MIPSASSEPYDLFRSRNFWFNLSSWVSTFPAPVWDLRILLTRSTSSFTRLALYISLARATRLWASSTRNRYPCPGSPWSKYRFSLTLGSNT